MTQIAKVNAILGDGTAKVGVQRKTACGHDCADCAGCETVIKQPEVVVVAQNSIGAKQGDIVLVESSTGGILKVAMVVYIVPFVLFFLGYFLSSILGGGEGLSVAAALLGFALGLLLAGGLDRYVKHKQSLQFRIVEITLPCSGM